MEDLFDPNYDSLLVKIDKPQEIINTYRTRDGENRTEHPGRIICTIGLIDERYHNIGINDLFGSYPKWNENQKIINCKHKTEAAFYHLQTIIKEINYIIEQYKNPTKPTGAGANYEYQNHILIYETESFLFQIKGNLDLIIFLLSDHIKCLKEFHTFKHSGAGAEYKAGGRILKELTNKGFDIWYTIFEEERIKWIQELVIMRDEITHYSKLKGFLNFIEDPNIENEYTIVHLPKMPNGKRVDVYCNEIFNHLLTFYKRIFENIKKESI